MINNKLIFPTHSPTKCTYYELLVPLLLVGAVFLLLSSNDEMGVVEVGGALLL